MDNLEYLKDMKKKDDERKKNKESLPHYVSEWEIEYRRTKALEIIAETLIGIDDKFNSLINDGKVINVDTHEV